MLQFPGKIVKSTKKILVEVGEEVEVAVVGMMRVRVEVES